ncbi:MAG: beta-aspartyl-peptidase [Candidatus Cloacimonadota bacterium]|nr:MAG: beta-aspartyl-peptidase [Candidatus Cloacimonadota bacterium]PIE78427.1 MAG: beta-aspartyl-peptidase [Candidatus Delongbacteria bacterium]
MKLELGEILISDIQFGEKTEVKNGVLSVNKEELIALISEDSRLKSVDLEIARPGESVRIMPVKDVIEPRTKVSGAGHIFPGWFSGQEEMVGDGRTHVLKGAAVVTTGKVVGFQEGIIDMSGEGAKYTPYSTRNCLVVVAEPNDECSRYEHEEALRLAGLKSATYLGDAGKDVEPDKVETFEYSLLSDDENLNKLPRVGYVYMLQSQGLLHDTYLYGKDAKNIIPTIISPTEVMDGAIVSGNCVSACDKNATYIHMNNPVIHDLYERHGKDYNFVAVIVTNENVTLSDKERSSNYVAKLAKELKLDAAIVSEEGFGNPDADLIMNCSKLENLGIKTVLLTDEYAGRDGASQSLADSHPKADAVVTNSNANEVITIPPMEKVIGHQNYADVIAGGFDGSLHEDGSITVEIQAIMGSTCELGFNNLTARGY